MSTPKTPKKVVPEAYKLRVERSDASPKAQYALLAVAQTSVMDILNGAVEIAPGKVWKQGTLAGNKWDVAALQCLTDLLLKRLQGRPTSLPRLGDALEVDFEVTVMYLTYWILYTQKL